MAFEYDEAFKRAAVQRVLDGEQQKTVANDLSLGTSTLRKWQRQYENTEELAEQIPLGHYVKGVSKLVDADGVVKQQWIKTNVEAENARKMLEAAAKAFCENIEPVQPVKAPQTLDGLCSTYIVTDYHMGQMSWMGETGEAWDLEIAENTLLDWFTRAIETAPASQVGILAQLGDFLHYDGLKQITPTSGHVLDAAAKYPDIVGACIRVLRRIVDMMLLKHQTVHIIMAEGNHDLASSVWLRGMFEALYENEPRVTVDNTHTPFYCYEWGDTALFFHHGHCKRMGDISSTFAGTYREVYGRTKFAYAHMGHYHHIASKEDSLMVVEQHPTLAAKDSHSTRGGYNSMRSASVITYSKDAGEVARSTLRPMKCG